MPHAGSKCLDIESPPELPPSARSYASLALIVILGLLYYNFLLFRPVRRAAHPCRVPRLRITVPARIVPWLAGAILWALATSSRYTRPMLRYIPG